MASAGWSIGGALPASLHCAADGGGISGTSNMNIGFCGTGMENSFHADYFKPVQ